MSCNVKRKINPKDMNVMVLYLPRVLNEQKMCVEGGRDLLLKYARLSPLRFEGVAEMCGEPVLMRVR